MNAKDGNIPHEGPFDNKEEFKRGDIVALNETALKIRGQLEAMTPLALYRLVGHPNEFMVLETFETEEDGKCLMLPCCMYFENRQDKNRVHPRCKGHPAAYFKKIGEIRIPQKGDKTSAVLTPLGDLFRLEWKDDPDHPELNAHLFGINLGGLIGQPAQWLKKLAEDQKIL